MKFLNISKILMKQLVQPEAKQDPEPKQYSEKEIEQLRVKFSKFTTEENDNIDKSRLIKLFEELRVPVNDIDEIMSELGIIESNIEFEEFFSVLTEAEKRAPQEQKKPDLAQFEEVKVPPKGESDELVIEIDTKVLDILRLVEEFRKKCVGEGNYKDANRAKQKFEELRRKETVRQINIIKAKQEQELQAIEEAQRAQFVEFSEAWDRYLKEYEQTALASVEQLKSQQAAESEEFRKRNREDIRAKQKFSKSLLEIRTKEQALVKLNKYEEAEKVKARADHMEQGERQKMEQEGEEQLAKRESNLKSQQNLALAALLKRVQRDRHEQLKQRQLDSQRLIQRNKNLLNDVLSMHQFEIRKALECLKQNLGVTKGFDPSVSTISK